MEAYKITALKPKNVSVKSFYGKANIAEDGEGNKFLISYNTVVCGFKGNALERYWNGYSQTTMRHINEAAKQIAGIQMNKKAWDALKVDHNAPYIER
jgi:hypothetical protein